MLRYVDTFHTSREVARLKVREISRFNKGQLQITMAGLIDLSPKYAKLDLWIFLALANLPLSNSNLGQTGTA